jgi:hypothetical protein
VYTLCVFRVFAVNPSVSQQELDHTTLDCTTLDYTTLDYTTLDYTTLDYTTLDYTTLDSSYLLLPPLYAILIIVQMLRIVL